MPRVFFIMLFLVCSCQTQNNSKAGWQEVFQNDATGKAVFGEKSKLIDAVRLGYPIRIGWGGMRVKHVADADFLTVFQGEEVFAQTKSIIGKPLKLMETLLKSSFDPKIIGLKLQEQMVFLQALRQTILKIP